MLAGLLFYSHRHLYLKQSLNACGVKSLLYITASTQSALILKKEKLIGAFSFPCFEMTARTESLK